MLDRKKHRQEVESLKADNRMKDMELGKAYSLLFKIVKLFTPAKPPFPWKVMYSQVLGVRMWIHLGHYSACHSLPKRERG